MIEYRTFFGDGEKTFAFPTPEIIAELEAKTGHGVGALRSRLENEQFTFAELLHIIRLGLIGGGSVPREADRLVAYYGVARPWRESHLIAYGIMNALFFGVKEPTSAFDLGNDEPDDDFPAPVDAAATGDLAAAINAAYQDVAE